MVTRLSGSGQLLEQEPEHQLALDVVRDALAQGGAEQLVAVDGGRDVGAG